MDRDAADALLQRALDHIEETDPEALQWAQSIYSSTFKSLKAKAFISQYCYVVYASGFRAKTIQACFIDLKAAFKDFDIERLARMRSITAPMKVFANERKARGFLAGVKLIADEGFTSFKRRLKKSGVEVLEELPGIGTITRDHLAKNIGLADVAKADIWLERAAAACTAKDTNELVDYLHVKSGLSKHVVDVAIWNYGKDGKLDNNVLDARVT